MRGYTVRNLPIVYPACIAMERAFMSGIILSAQRLASPLMTESFNDVLK
jgi:hypothetical protein